jgi:hypothetical protein
VGKCFLTSAIAQKACRDGYSTLYLRADGRWGTSWHGLSRIDVLVIDERTMVPLSESERSEVCEICGGRYQTRSSFLTSQLPSRAGTSEPAQSARQRRFAPTAVHLGPGTPSGFPPESPFTFSGISKVAMNDR